MGLMSLLHYFENVRLMKNHKIQKEESIKFDQMFIINGLSKHFTSSLFAKKEVNQKSIEQITHRDP